MVGESSVVFGIGNISVVVVVVVRMQHSRAFSRILTRLFLALLLFTCFTILFIAKCGLNLDQDDNNNNNDNNNDNNNSDDRWRLASIQGVKNPRRRRGENVEGETRPITPPPPPWSNRGEDPRGQRLPRGDDPRESSAPREEVQRREIVSLRLEIETLRQRIRGDLSLNQDGPTSPGPSPAATGVDLVEESSSSPPERRPEEQPRDHVPLSDLPGFLASRLSESEAMHGQVQKNEYEVIPYHRFTNTRLFLVDPGLGRRVVEKPIGLRKKEISQVGTETDCLTE